MEVFQWAGDSENPAPVSIGEYHSLAAKSNGIYPVDYAGISRYRDICSVCETLTVLT